MKNLICLILALALLLAACGGCSKPAESGDLSTAGGSESEKSSSTAEETPPTARPEFTGNVVFLETEPDFEYEYTINVIEAGGVIVFCGKSAEITAFSAESGELLYKANCGDGYVIRLEPYDRKVGYDYRLVMEDRVIYRSTTDGDKELTEALPNGMVFDHTKFPCEVKNVYDINENSFVWAADDGIMLSDSDGSNPRLVLDNSELTDINNVVTDFEFSFEHNSPRSYSYQDPRFILDGTKLVAAIIDDGIYRGVVLYNIVTGETEIGHFIFEPDIPNYPLSDRYIEDGWYLTDASTGDIVKKSEVFPDSTWFDTFDGKTAYYHTYGLDGDGNQSDYTNLHIYVGDIAESENGFKLLFHTENPYVDSSFTFISSHYLLVSLQNSVIAVKYSV